MNHRFTITAALASAAASTALLPLLSGGKWFFGGLGAVIVVALVGTATRHRAVRALPAVVCLLCALVALALYLNLIYAAHYSYGHLIPSPRSLSYLWHSAVTALRATKSQSPPVPATVGIELVAGAGIGLVAALTDLIAVRLRRCALAGLPLLVMFSVPIATDTHANATQSTVAFCLGIVGYLALLSTDGRERLRLWGRLVTPWNASHPDEQVEELGGGPSSRALAASGRRIGLAAVVLALFAPLLIPGLHAQKLFAGVSTGNGHGNGSGGSGTDLSVNPLVSMTNNLKQNTNTDLFSYTTTDPNDPQYLVEQVLSQLSDYQATAAPAGSGEALSPATIMPAIPGLRSGTWPLVTTNVTMGTAQWLSDGYLPVPYAPRRIRVSRQTVSVIPSTLLVATPLTSLANLTYSVMSQDVSPTPAQLSSITTRPTGVGNLEVPKALTSLHALARTIVGTGASTPYDEAVALQKWFRTSGGFTYSINTPSLAKNKPDALLDFLTRTKTGFCQQFSFAMTVLARLLGIPARVAVGFDPGTRIGSSDRYRVDGSDAHAWTELYFTGYGWTTWDPTPAGNEAGQADLAPPLYSTGGSPSTTGTGPGSGSTSPTSPQGPRAHVAENIYRNIDARLGGGANPGPVAPPLPSASPAGSATPIALMVLAALLVAAVVAPRISRSVIRRRRWLAARGDAGIAHAAWAELLDNLTDYGIGHGAGETPRSLAKRVGAQQHLTGAPREALGRLAQAEERASYARQAAPAGALAEDVASVRAAVSTRVRAGVRWRALLMPPSAVEGLRRVMAHALDAFGWIEVVTTRLARRMPRIKAEQN
ncbi:MAG: transglutaminase TgpA family protein [Streptosporangiaceae bacterium]